MSKILKQGNLRADKTLYEDGVGCCVWYPIGEELETEDVAMGIYFDFPIEDIDDLILLLQELKKEEAYSLNTIN